MNTDFDYEIVPRGYAHCFNDNCSKAGSCLRHCVAQHCTADVPFITILSPACFPATSAECAYFAPIRKMRVAWGVKKLFDNLPYNKASDIRNQIIVYFGRTHYYRIYRKERFISPEDQQVITALSRRPSLIRIRKSISGDLFLGVKQFVVLNPAYVLAKV